MKLFIDTNILLSFYHLTSEDIEELKKLVALVEQNKINLLLPQQVVDEFYRNREGKISDALKMLRQAKFNPPFPAFCKDYEEYGALQDILNDANKKHAELVDRATEDAQARCLKADSIIEKLFAKANKIEATNEIRERAVRRTDIGNPPGKKGSLGDAINWECLLEFFDNADEVFFVSGDTDYASPLDDTTLNEFLEREWDDKIASELHFFRKISDFFKEKFPHIKLASEIEKDLLIQKLAASGSFASTHNIISKLSKYSEFTLPQLEQIISSAEYNNQVGWIVGDPDLQIFFKALHEKYGGNLAPELNDKLEEFIAVEDEADEIPF